jgi:hypothetical protein
MKIGLMFANGAAASEPDRAVELAVQAESLGFESLWAVTAHRHPRQFHVPVPLLRERHYPRRQRCRDSRTRSSG